MRTQLKSIVITAGLAAGLTVPQSVWAAGTGWFGGIGTVRPSLEFESRSLSGSISDSFSSRKVHGAYQFTRHWGVEMGADLANQNSGNIGLIDPGSIAPGYTPRGWELSGTGTWSFGQKFGLIGRLGAYRGELDVNPNQAGLPDGKTRASYGLGLKYDFTRNFRVQGGWDRYRLRDASTSGDGEVDLVSIGLKYKF